MIEDRVERVESIIANLIQIIGNLRKEQYVLEEKVFLLKQELLQQERM